MITLYQFARTWSIPNLSQFCVKLETYLRINKLPYQIIETLPLKAPYGKLPYIEDNGRIIADSRIIINHLRSVNGDTDLKFLSSAEQAVSKSYQRLLEEHLYWIAMATRWNSTNENWQTNKQAIFSVLPPLVRDLAASLYRRKIKSQIIGHGIGRLTWNEMFELGREDIDSLVNFLVGKPYFMGTQPTSLDASAFGILINIVACPIESPLKEYTLAQSNLVDFCRRIQSEYYPELPCDWV